jgi:hypothetical protein
MNRTSPLPAAADPLDRALHGYFHSQLPVEWPAAPVEVKTACAPSPTRRSTARFTLAASIALLLGLGATLSYAPQSPTAPAGSGLLNDASADGKKLEKHIFPDHQPTLPGTSQ